MNILCMGGRTVGPAVAWDLVETFLAAEFSRSRAALAPPRQGGCPGRRPNCAVTQGCIMNDPSARSPVAGDLEAVESAEGHGSLLVLAMLSLVAGAASGIVGAVFRLALQHADRLRDAFIDWAHGDSAAGLPLVVATCAAATAVAAWLVRRFSPYASGSGIPHVEAVLNEDLPQAPFILIPVKFFGGLLAIGAGLALGREGPSVQLGGSISHLVGKLFRRNWPDCQVLLAAGAGAGLATAFNAPIAGAVFVLEELVRRFDTRIIIATCGASASAIAVARVILGEAPDFAIKPLSYSGFGMLPTCLVLGVFAGVLGVVYNRAILGALATAERLHRWPVELRAGVIGAAVGLLAWFAPIWSAAAMRLPSARSLGPKWSLGCR